MTLSKPLLELQFRPVEAPAEATPGAQVFALLPPLGEILRQPGFGTVDPICLPGTQRPFEPRMFFAGYAARRHLH